MIVYKGKLLKKSSNWKLKLVGALSCQRWSLLTGYMAFNYCNSFATALAANFSCNPFRIIRHSFQAFAPAIWSCCAVWFKSEQTPFSWTGGWFQPACCSQDSIQNMLFCSYVIFLLRDQWLIERWSEGACWGQQRLQPTWKCPVFVLASPTSPSCAGAWPQEFGHWFCSQKPGIAFGSEWEMTGRG